VKIKTTIKNRSGKFVFLYPEEVSDVIIVGFVVEEARVVVVKDTEVVVNKFVVDAVFVAVIVKLVVAVSFTNRKWNCCRCNNRFTLHCCSIEERLFLNQKYFV
jgi:hypothetical protein